MTLRGRWPARVGAAVSITTVALSLLALPGTTGAADPKRRIGVLHVGDHVPPALPPLVDGLRALGYEAGRDIVLEVRNLADDSAAPSTAAEFVRTAMDVIVAFGDPAVRAARAATSEIPIVMVHATDPVAQGFARTLARPGGNMTGFVFFAVSPGKQVELFKEIVPRLRRLLVIVDARDPTSAAELVDVRRAAGVLKIALVERNAADEGELARIFSSLGPAEIDGVLAASNAVRIKLTSALIRLAAERGVPLAGYRREAVRQGALFSYAPDDTAVGRQAAAVVDRILRGARAGELPIEQPRTFQLVVNTRSAAALGIAVPAGVLLRADEVIQ